MRLANGPGIMSRLSSVLVVLFSHAAFLQVGCGGCPWVDSSSATVTPATACLQVEISKGDRHLPDGDGGCVTPIVFGTNTCGEALTFAADVTTAGSDVVVAPGEAFEVGIPLDSSTPDGDDYAFAVPAKLGTADLTITFKTYSP